MLHGLTWRWDLIPHMTVSRDALIALWREMSLCDCVNVLPCLIMFVSFCCGLKYRPGLAHMGLWKP